MNECVECSYKFYSHAFSHAFIFCIGSTSLIVYQMGRPCGGEGGGGGVGLVQGGGGGGLGGGGSLGGN